jgi:aminomethyltransferase
VTERTVLRDVQAAAGGKFVDFSGWDMPVQFAGITAEHLAVRSGCGVFDLGHMGRLILDGPDALSFLVKRVCRPLSDMKPSQVRYGLVLAEDGTVEDDVLVSRDSERRWHVVVNAGNRAKLLDLWKPALTANVGLRDITTEQGMIAVQGPKAAALLASIGLDGTELKYYRFVDRSWNGSTVRLSRTGYTGEDGFECFVPVAQTVSLWEAVRSAGATVCGLGARDTLRLEAGMPLYGHELDRSTTPVEAGLGFAVDPNGSFIGAATVQRQLREGTPKKLVGLRMRDKRVPRQGYAVVADGKPVGVVTSGTLSPTLGQAIGMAYVPSALSAVGTALDIDIRGTICAAEVVPLPFYKRAK